MKHVTCEFVMVRQLISSDLCQEVEFHNELNQGSPSLFEGIQLGHGHLFFRRVFKEFCYDCHKFWICFVVKIMGRSLRIQLTISTAVPLFICDSKNHSLSSSFRKATALACTVGRVEKEWEAIPHSIHRDLVESMHRKAAAVIEAKGAAQSTDNLMPLSPIASATKLFQCSPPNAASVSQ